MGCFEMEKARLTPKNKKKRTFFRLFKIKYLISHVETVVIRVKELWSLDIAMPYPDSLKRTDGENVVSTS